jgi:hypothetical protein
MFSDMVNSVLFVHGFDGFHGASRIFSYKKSVFVRLPWRAWQGCNLCNPCPKFFLCGNNKQKGRPLDWTARKTGKQYSTLPVRLPKRGDT